MKTYKCGFAHCMCDEPLTDDNCIIQGSRRWHKKCFQAKETAEEIRKYYRANISSQVTMSFLNSVLNDVLYKKKVDAEYLLFALKYAYETNKEIKSPVYLHYLADDKRIQRLYKTTHSSPERNKKVSIDTEFDFSDKETVPMKTQSFSDILRKG